jgi:hypothetical protein
MKLTHNIIALAAAALLGSFLAPSAYAAACAAGTEDDFTYRGETASECEAYGGNESDPLSAFGTTWDLFAKFDGDQDTAVDTIFTGSTLDFGGGKITFSLKYLGLLADGYYGYELIASANPTSLLPASMDLVGSVKQANGYQTYLFESVLVDSSGNLGTFKSLFGPNANGDFSHFSIYGGNYVANGNGNGNGNGNDVPEPATLALLGLGLLGAGALRRRRPS